VLVTVIRYLALVPGVVARGAGISVWGDRVVEVAAHSAHLTATGKLKRIIVRWSLTKGYTSARPYTVLQGPRGGCYCPLWWTVQPRTRLMGQGPMITTEVLR
jgi:hypothetical protein